jgi:hypothetical protein
MIILFVQKSGKIRIEQIWTGNGIATDLLNVWVPIEVVVLAFHFPIDVDFKRICTKPIYYDNLMMKFFSLYSV